jgi:hypothetical protein
MTRWRLPLTGFEDEARKPTRPAPQRQGAPVERASAEHGDGADEVRSLQRAAGNRLLWRLLGRSSTDAGEHPTGALANRSPGQPLAPGVRQRMEHALGADLGDVRVHTGEAVASEVRRHGAEAMAIGRHVAFDHGRYRPGTLLGDAMIAHELAHTLQQRAAGPGSATGSAGSRLEADANRSALGAVATLWGGATRAAGRAVAGAGPRLAAGTQLQFLVCERTPAFETPDFLGEHSLATIRRLNDKMELFAYLGPLIAIGTAGVVGFGPPSDPSDTVESAALALAGMPTIQRAVIVKEVSFLLLSHENDMNAQEREFWYNILRRLEAM